MFRFICAFEAFRVSSGCHGRWQRVPRCLIGVPTRRVARSGLCISDAKRSLSASLRSQPGLSQKQHITICVGKVTGRTSMNANGLRRASCRAVPSCSLSALTSPGAPSWQPKHTDKTKRGFEVFFLTRYGAVVVLAPRSDPSTD
jgi:hypothetical protein